MLYSTDVYLYWSEDYQNTIYRSDLDGNTVREFYQADRDLISEIRLLGEYLYYITLNNM